MKTFTKYVALVFVLLSCFHTTYGQSDEYTRLFSLFNGEWRAATIEVLETHLEYCEHCDFHGGALDIARNMQIFLSPFDGICATAYPTDDDLRPNVFVNLNGCGKLKKGVGWTVEYAVETLLHEITHVFKKDGNYLCGPDAPGSPLFRGAPCHMFGATQYSSYDITLDIRDHFRKEIKSLKKKNYDTEFPRSPR